MAFSNARILYNYATWDAGSLSTSSSISGRRVTNLLVDRLGAGWRTAGGDVTLEWARNALAAPTQITCMGIFGANWTAAATLYVQANSSDSWGSPAYNLAVAVPLDTDGVPWRHVIIYLDQTYRYWRFSWDDPTNPDGYLMAGRWIAGQYYELTRNFSRGARISWGDPTVIEHKPGTVEVMANEPELRPRFRQIRAAFPWRGTTEMRKWEAIFRRVGNSRPIVIGLDPLNYPTEKGIYGYITTELEEVWERYSRHDIATMVFEEKTF